jgi:DNA adenine methylase
MKGTNVNIIRYPGGKQRMLDFLMRYLPTRDFIPGRLVEPFVGSGAVFLATNPKRALLSDMNDELIDLYRGLRLYPLEVWRAYRGFPSTCDGYYRVRSWNPKDLDLAHAAARTLYLNRTCFKGMWRHNSTGEFNVGYGGQDRRWVIGQDSLLEISRRLRRATLRCADFEDVIDGCNSCDFLFVDPPYKAGAREMTHDHYRHGKFSMMENKRLAATLRRATARGVHWAITTSAHPDIVRLFRKCQVIPFQRGTGKRIGELVSRSGEVLILNY